MRAKLSGFTPVLDIIVQRFDIYAALVYGRVWRYCQMPSGECYQSYKALAEETGMSISQLKIKLKMLEDAGLLENRGLTRAGGTTRWAVLDDMVVSIGIEMAEEATVEPPPSHPVATPSHVVATKDSIKIQEDIKDLQSDLQSDVKPLTDHQRMVGVLGEVCIESVALNAGHMNKLSKDLRKGGYTPEKIQELYSEGGLWYRRTKEGKGGKKPRLYDVRQTIEYLAKIKTKTHDQAVKEAGYE